MSGYLAWHHDNKLYGDATAKLANCPHTETVDCDVVNTSPWSELMGVPIAAYAVPTYLLVLVLTWADRSRSTALAYAFSIGVLATLLSGFLFYISKTQIGFLCLWCMRLYAVNVSIPILASVAARRSPLALLGRTLADLRSWPRGLRWALGFFVVALGVTVAAQKGYRSWLEKTTAREIERIESEGGPTVPAIPQDPSGRTPAPGPADESGVPAPVPAPTQKGGTADGGDPPISRALAPRPRRGELAPLPGLLRPVTLFASAPAAEAPSGAAPPAGAPPGPAPPARQEAPAAEPPAPPAVPPPAAPYHLAGPLRRVSGGRSGMKSEPFDLQSRLGKGKPLALIFWAPGYRQSESALMEWTPFFRGSASAFEVYAVSGRRRDQKDEEIWENFSMMDQPVDLPLLVDDDFKVSNALNVADVPNVALFDARGTLVIAKIKHRRQMLVVQPENATAEEIVKKLSAGGDVPTIQRMFPYYPATELYGKCAPSFTLKKFNSNQSFTFAGRSSSRLPTMLIFWSSTCAHCQVEIPHLVAWLKEHPGKIEVVSVTHIKAERPNEPSHRKVTEAYLRSQGISWVVLEDPDRAVEELYGTVSTPTLYFIDPDGTVQDAWFYAHEHGFDQAMAKELARVVPTGATCRGSEPRSGPRMDFSVLGPDGRRVGLDSLVDRPTLVHFWATWCVPCARELPSLLRFRDGVEKEAGGRLILVSVENENARPQIQGFQKRVGSDLRSYHAPAGGIAEKVDLSYRVPRTYLIGPGGAVLDSWQGEQKWDDAAFRERVRSRLKNSGA